MIQDKQKAALRILELVARWQEPALWEIAGEISADIPKYWGLAAKDAATADACYKRGIPAPQSIASAERNRFTAEVRERDNARNKNEIVELRTLVRIHFPQQLEHVPEIDFNLPHDETRIREAVRDLKRLEGHILSQFAEAFEGAIDDRTEHSYIELGNEPGEPLPDGRVADPFAELDGVEPLPGGLIESVVENVPQVASRVQAKPASVNALMIELMQKHGQEECLNWSVRQWALELEPRRGKKPSASTIHGTATYKLLKGLNDETKAAMVERQTEKGNKGKRRSTRF